MWQSFRQALREFGYAEGHGRVFLINRVKKLKKQRMA